MVGHWWLPEEPQEAQPGILTIADDGELLLELIGGFDLEIRTPTPDGHGYSVSMFERSPSVVHGETDKGAITLIDCGTRRASGFGRPTHHVLGARRALIGIRLDAEDETIFSSAYVRIENLLTWLQLSPAQLSYGGPDGETSAVMKQPIAMTAVGFDFDYEAGVRTVGFNAEFLRGRVSIVGQADPYLRLIPSNPVSYSAFDAATKAMMDLLTLASDQACGIISLVLIVPEGRVFDQGPGQEPLVLPLEVEVIGRHIHTAEPEAKAQDGRKFLFTCAQVPFEDAISRWLHIRSTSEAACNVLFGMEYSDPGFTGTRALLVAVAAEAFHRTLYGNKSIESDTKSLRARVLAVIEETDLRKWASERLRNEPSYRERLLSLASRPATAAVELLIPNVDDWVDQLVSVRNGLAHRGDHGDVLDLHKLTLRTSYLLRLVLMNELGIDADRQHEAVQSRWHLHAEPPNP